MMWTIQPKSEFKTLSGIAAGANTKRVIFIHGVGLCADSWLPQISYFSEQYKVIALDLPGHGQSRLEKSFNFRDFVMRVEDAIGDQDYVLVGHSLGALIALNIALENPPNMRGFVCANPIYHRNENAKRAVLERASALGEGSTDNEATLNRWFGNEYPELREQTEKWLSNNHEGYATAYRIFAQYKDPPRSALRAVNIPALAITGEHDQNSSPKMSVSLARDLKHGESAIIKNARHMMPLTHSKTFNAELANFLKRIEYD